MVVFGLGGLRRPTKRRRIDIASLEDKIVQQAMVRILNQIYEVDFRGFSYGFSTGTQFHIRHLTRCMWHHPEAGVILQSSSGA